MSEFYKYDDRIDRIEIQYYRRDLIEDLEEGDYIENYYEEVTVDRKTESIYHHRDIADGFEIDHEYHLDLAIVDFLDSLDVDIFSDVKGNFKDVVRNKDTDNFYTITVLTENGNNREIMGTFDKNGLPKDYPSFIDSLYNFLSYYGIGDIFDDDIYGKVLRRKDELIVCGVVFKNTYKNYYYITDDDSLNVGDFVLVPAGDLNKQTVAQINSKGYYSLENIPYPLNKIKKIIRRCSLSDFE